MRLRFLSAFLLLGCSGATAGVADATDAGPSTTPTPSDATVSIHVRSTAAPVAHDDGLSGQTPTFERLGIRSLTLSHDANDPSPWTVFDYGADATETSLDDGADTVVARVKAPALHAGTYTVARVAVSHVRYGVHATVHSQGFAVPGDLSTTEVLSNGTHLDGATHDRGWFTQTFVYGGMQYARTGDDAPVPQVAATGGIALDTSGPVAAYVFSVSLDVEPHITHDRDITFELNVHEDFRWRDETAPGYAPGVWDATPPAYEPVVTFGANSFRVVLSP